MATSQMSEVIRQLRRTALLRDKAGMPDGELLESFISCRDEAAMEVLVRRHGPMVWGVCRRVLRNHHDAEDAFQATFLVLVRKAASIASRERLANWLYGVAHQTALKARATAARRRVREKQVKEMPEPAAAEQDLWNGLRRLLDGELRRLPDKYRVVIVLCDLEANTRKEAARQLGLPEGTVASRLTRARTMLAKRLARHGLAVSGGALATALSEKAASACVPPAVVSYTIKAVAAVTAGQAASGTISSQVAALTEGVMKAMFLNKLKIATVVLLTAGLLTFSAGTLLVPPTGGTAAGGEREREVQRADSAKVGESRDVQVRIAGPIGMQVCVLTAAGQGNKIAPIEAPGRFSLKQGKRSRLNLADIPNRPGVERFFTVEIPKVGAHAESFVSTSAIPIEFTDEDFDHVNDGKAITKVVYLKTGTKGQKPAGRQGEPITIASYDDPERDVIEEARRSGTVLAVVRMGNIDLAAGEPDKDQGQAKLLVERAGTLVKVTLGNDGILGRVLRLENAGPLVKVTVGNDGIPGRLLRLNKENAKAKGKDNRADQLANQLEHVMRDVATVQAENEALRQRLKAAGLEARSLRALMELKERELKKAKAAHGK